MYLNTLGKYLITNTNTCSSQTTNTITQNLYLIAIKYKYNKVIEPKSDPE